MANKRNDSGYFWVDKALTCNGCKFLNFYKCGCRRNQEPGKVRPLSSYTNGDDYVAVLKPTDCDYQKDHKPQANDTVSIVPTAKDKEKFANQFKKYADGATGLMFFKQNSRVYKEWIALLKKNNLKVKSRPQPGFYFGIWGKGSSRLFEHDGKLYMSLNYNQDFEDPQDCEPILGSEFYKVLEELEHNKKK